jgi:hypothetical protein
MATLVVPGVRVEAKFDVLPPPLAQAGIVGVVGIVDRAPADGGLVSVTKVTELRELLGPGTEASMPEAVHALANGASELVVSPVSAGKPSELALLNDGAAPAVLLRSRSTGAWANDLRAEVRETRDASNKIQRVGIRLYRNGRTVENFDDLQLAPGSPDDLFDAINTRSRFLVALDPGLKDALPKKDTYAFSVDATSLPVPIAGETKPLMTLVPDAGVDPSGLSVKIDTTTAGKKVSVQVFQRGLQESFSDLTMNPDSDRYLPYVLLTQSRLVHVELASSLPAGEGLPRGTDIPVQFGSGTSPNVADYTAAIDKLADDTRIDLVVAAIDPSLSRADAMTIHQALVAHAVAMADAGAPRIAFGSVTADEQSDLAKIKEHAAAARNRRFVLVAPAGAAGAVAGAIGRMRPEESATFKTVPLMGLPPAKYRESELNRLLGTSTNALVVQDRAGRGVIVLRAIDTTGDQISVTRVADECIRETKAIAENFIGTLNNDDSRMALKQQIVAMLTRLERAGALVPSVDGEDPAFAVDVYSTQQDFAQGIVRIDIAVRPARSMDYFYATIRVKN